MATNPDPDPNHLRIAIALTVLNFKPVDQSIASYVLDLQAIFASSTKTRNDQEATLALLTPSRLPISKGYEPSNEAGIAVVTETTETAWRAHALALERDFEALKAKYDEERIRNIALASGTASSSGSGAGIASITTGNGSKAGSVSNTSSSAALPAYSSLSSASENVSSSACGSASTGPTALPAGAGSNTTQKKKTKKKVVTVPIVPVARPGPEMVKEAPKVDFKQLVEDLSNGIPGSDSLFCALDAFETVTSRAPARSYIEPDLVLSVTIRVIDAVGCTLDLALSTESPKAPSDVQRLDQLGICLHHVLFAVIPHLAPKAHQTRKARVDSSEDASLNLLLSKLTSRVFHPLINAFLPLSLAFMSAIIIVPAATIPPASSSSKSIPVQDQPKQTPTALPTDIRAEALSLFKIVFSAGECCARQLLGAGLRASLALEAIRGLEATVGTCRCAPVVSRANADGIETGMRNERDNVASADDERRRATGDTSSNRVPGRTGERERLETLARSDALWFLCALLHILCAPFSTNSDVEFWEPTPPPAGPKSPGHQSADSGGQAAGGDCLSLDAILRQVVLDALFGIVTRFKRCSRKDGDGDKLEEGRDTNRRDEQAIRRLDSALREGEGVGAGGHCGAMNNIGSRLGERCSSASHLQGGMREKPGVSNYRDSDGVDNDSGGSQAQGGVGEGGRVMGQSRLHRATSLIHQYAGTSGTKSTSTPAFTPTEAITAKSHGATSDKSENPRSHGAQSLLHPNETARSGRSIDGGGDAGRTVGLGSIELQAEEGFGAAGLDTLVEGRMEGGPQARLSLFVRQEKSDDADDVGGDAMPRRAHRGMTGLSEGGMGMGVWEGDLREDHQSMPTTRQGGRGPGVGHDKDGEKGRGGVRDDGTDGGEHGEERVWLREHCCGGRAEEDEVGYTMVLGVLERYWVWSLDTDGDA